MHEQFKKLYVSFGLFGALAFAGIIALVLTTVPKGVSVVVLFYALLFLVILFFGSIVELVARKRFAVADFKSLVKASLRQSALLGLLVVTSLILQANQLLFWWVGASLVLFFLSFEVFLSI